MKTVSISRLKWLFKTSDLNNYSLCSLKTFSLGYVLFSLSEVKDITDCPRPRMVGLIDFLTLQWCQSDIHAVETESQILNFDLFLG